MLLSNIIPHHVVEEIKVSGKYSENRDMVAVMFASITNWNEMYEESFEGTRCVVFVSIKTFECRRFAIHALPQ